MIKILISDCVMLYLLWQVSYCTHLIHSLHNIMDLQTSKHVCIVMCFNCYLFLYHVSVQLVESEFHIKINFYVQKLSGKCQYLCVVYTKRS